MKTLEKTEKKNNAICECGVEFHNAIYALSDSMHGVDSLKLQTGLCEDCRVSSDAYKKFIESEEPKKLNKRQLFDRQFIEDVKYLHYNNKKAESLAKKKWLEVEGWTPDNLQYFCLISGAESQQGKTFLAFRLAYDLFKRDKVKSVFYLNQSDLGALKNRTTTVDKAKKCSLFIFDDIGKASTQGAIDLTYSIIESRNAEKKPMILTLNYAPEKLESLFQHNGKYISQRLIQYSKIVNFDV